MNEPATLAEAASAVDPDALAQLVERIVADQLPADLPTYRAESRAAVEELVARARATGDDEEAEASFFVDGAAIMSAISAASALIGTFTTLLQLPTLLASLRQLGRKKRLDRIGRVWRDELVQAGLSESVAEEIAARFSADLADLAGPRN